MSLRARTIKATGVSTFRTNLKTTLDDVFTKHQTLIVTRPDDENVVVISENYYNELQKEISNLQYLLKLAKADQEIDEGKLIKMNLDNM